MNNFAKDLSYGQQREQDFIALVPFLGLQACNGLLEDFVDAKGRKYELKAERRTTSQTLNIAIEIISSYRRPGAIYNAFKNGVKYFCVLYADNRYFIYDCARLYYLSKRIAKKQGVINVYGSNAKIILLNRGRIACLQRTP